MRMIWSVVLAVSALLGGIGLWLPAVAAATAPPSLPNLPAQLQKYVPGTAAFAAAPWMTSPACAGHGGDFSIWTASVLHDTPDLLAVFQPGLVGTLEASGAQTRRDALLDGYRRISASSSAKIPAGVCVEDVARWRRQAPVATPPFGFAHALTAEQLPPFGVAWGAGADDAHRSGFRCIDSARAAAGRGGILGAERAPCDGFHLDCPSPADADTQRCTAWNAFSDEYVRKVAMLRTTVNTQYPAVVTGTAQTRLDWPVLIVTGVALAAAAAALAAVWVLRRRADRAASAEDGSDATVA
ncbi:hypothetical protein [Amycolatopsis tolypomycina]|uniref:hypothetical protein n=1 Tax=Amycolatopsis tolypomycina TaxID=208445 RepID=UPI0033BDBF6C